MSWQAKGHWPETPTIWSPWQSAYLCFVGTQTLEVNAASYPIGLSFQRLSLDPNRTVGCAYWNEAQRAWATDGIEVVGHAADAVHCTTAHLTDFRPVYLPGDAAQSPGMCCQLLCQSKKKDGVNRSYRQNKLLDEKKNDTHTLSKPHQVFAEQLCLGW